MEFKAWGPVPVWADGRTQRGSGWTQHGGGRAAVTAASVMGRPVRVGDSKTQ
jgi:hypothetical protein